MSTANQTIACPAWCTEPAGHDVDEEVVIHYGRRFGKWVTRAGSDQEHVDAELAFGFESPVGSAEMAEVAEDAARVARWMAQVDKPLWAVCPDWCRAEDCSGVLPDGPERYIRHGRSVEDTIRVYELIYVESPDLPRLGERGIEFFAASFDDVEDLEPAAVVALARALLAAADILERAGGRYSTDPARRTEAVK